MKKNLKKIILLLFLINIGINQYGGDVEFPLVQSISFFPFFNNTLPQKNGYSLAMDLHYSNIFMFEHRRETISDLETFSSTLALRYGLFHSFALEVYYRFSFIHGGSLDRFVMKFHDFFNLPEAGRDEYPVDSVHYSFKDYFSYNDRTVLPASLMIAAAGQIYRSEILDVFGRVGLGIPLLTKPGFSSDKPFFCSGIILIYKLGSFSIDLSGYLSFFKTPEWLRDEPLKYNIFLYEIEASYKRFFSGFRYKSTPFKYGDLSHRGAQLFIGYRFGKRFEFGIIEDFSPYNTTPDLSANFKIILLKK